MKLAIIGSHDFYDYSLINQTCDKLNFHTVLSGGEGGIDPYIERYAWTNNKKVLIFLPDYEEYGEKSKTLRTKNMINLSNGVLFFIKTQTQEISDAIQICESLNKPQKIIQV